MSKNNWLFPSEIVRASLFTMIVHPSPIDAKHPENASVYEHFSLYVRTSKTKSRPKSEHTECVTRGFSWYVSTRFFLLSLVTFLPFSFAKEKEKESNEKKI